MLLSRLFELVEPQRYYTKVLGSLPAEVDAQGNVMVRCPFHADTTASMHIDIKHSGGLFKCFGCGAQGNFIQFHKRLHDVLTDDKAAVDIAELFGLDTASIGISYVDEAEIETAHECLVANDMYITHLTTERGVSLATIRSFKLGLENRTGRVTIPVRDVEGRVVNVRRWLPVFKRATDLDKNSKCIGTRGYNRPELFPVASLREQEIVVCEGELDCLMLLSNGFHAITSTHGATTFKTTWARMFRDKDVVLALDNDLVGRQASSRIREMLYEVTRSVKEVFLVPEIDGNDVTDYWQQDPAGFVLRFQTAVGATAPWLRQIDNKLVEVNLHQAARHDLINRRIRVQAIVNGREDTPMAIPSKVKLVCDCPKKGCVMCPGATGGGVEVKTITPDNPLFIDLITTPQNKQQPILAKMFGIACKDKEIEVVEYVNVEEVRLIPDLDMSEMLVQNLIRTAYITGYGLSYNDKYEFTGVTCIDPRTNLVTHIFDDARRINRVSEGLLSTDVLECDGVVASVDTHLRVFQPVKHKESVLSKLMTIWNDFEANVTRIVQRIDVLRGCDLMMHSAISFVFDGEIVVKGWIDTLIIGDTGCGKSKTVERYLQYVRGGEIYSGENISKVGIIGGYINMSGNGRPRFCLGVWPLNDKRGVWIDEASGMTRDLLSELTMMRDHGIAESTKQGQRNRYPARVRFGLISNPRPREAGTSNAMNSYGFGVQAIRDLIGADADISRFDIAVVAASDEVTVDDIHLRKLEETITPYTSDVCNLLLRWAWSRQPSHIQFEPAAVKRSKELAKEMSEVYDPSIPLVLGQSQRIKLARIGVAIAVRLYSTPDGECVVVTKEHIEAAHAFLVEDFSKPAMGYHAYSASQRRSNSLPNPQGVKVLLDQQDFMLVECFISNRILTRRLVEDVTGLHAGSVAQTFSELIRLRCIAPSGSRFALSPAFIRFLSTYKHPKATSYYESDTSDIEGVA